MTRAHLADLLFDHGRASLRRFGGGEAPRLFFSPGRVNLFGGHLDYNGGPVMPTAIDRGTFFAVRPRIDRTVRFRSTVAAEDLTVDLDYLPSDRMGRWSDYPLGVLVDLVARLRASGRGGDVHGLDIVFGGNLPIGAGLSSSASICVGTAYVLDEAWGLGLGVDERVRSALRAERGFVGVQCGIMDPFAVGYARPGHLLWLDCKDETFEHLPIDFSRLSILIANSGVQRELSAGAFNERVARCREAFATLAGFVPGATCLRDVPEDVVEQQAHLLSAETLRRARHVAGEVRRTFAARAALTEGDLETVGRIMVETHASLRDLYECSCPELDTIVEAAVDSASTFGARLTGAGFGGCAVVLTERGREEESRAHIRERFVSRFGRDLSVVVFGGDDGPREVFP